MKVSTKFFISLGEGVDNREIVVDDLADGATVKDLIQHLDKKYPEKKIRDAVLSKGEKLKVSLMVNKKSARLEHELSEGDEIVFLAIVSGG